MGVATTSEFKVLGQRSEQTTWTLIESMAGMLAAMRREPATSATPWAAVDALRYARSPRDSPIVGIGVVLRG